MRFLRRLAGVNWIPALVAPMAVVLMDVFWFYPWLVWAGKLDLFAEPKTPLSLGGTVFLVGGGFLATRYMLNRRWPTGLIQWSVVAFGLLVVFTVLRSEYHGGYELTDAQWFVHIGRVFLDSFSEIDPLMLALPAAAYLWWRGISRGRTTLYADDVYRTLVIGIASFVLLIIVWRISLGAGSLARLASDVAPNVVAFFFFSLVALALTNLHSIQQRMTPEEAVRAFNRRWLPILFAVVAAIVLAGMGIAAVFSPEFVGLLKNTMNALFDGVRQIMHYILIPLGYVAEFLIWIGIWLINLIRSDTVVEIEGGDVGPVDNELEEIPTGEPLPEIVGVILKWVLFALFAAVVMYFLARAVARFRSSRSRTDAEEFDESLWSWQGFKADLLAFVSSIWQRIWRRKKPAAATDGIPAWYLEEEGRETGRLSIREIYQRLLWQGFRFGVKHREHETPFEYRNRLSPEVPEGTDQLSELTTIYVDVRYGEIEPPEGDVDRANSLWKALKEMLRRPDVDQAGRRGRRLPG